MKLKKDELKVFYQSSEINRKLDEDIEDVLKKYGYSRWASGYAIEEKVRDLAFDLKD